MHTQALFDNIPQHIIAELNKAKESIYIAVAWFTRADIFAVLSQKARAGISIQLALSNDRINKNDKIAINQDELNHFNIPIQLKNYYKTLSINHLYKIKNLYNNDLND
ncbi:hypothetical protein [Moraxella sp. Pampa]|uniref:hypothetical protein n=1 Tax=Moraxella sp. Pampa TaxID=3111978 RepID=UPI002B40F4D7|nr:hypothetical protein [Moraxella sp. Pampa]